MLPRYALQKTQGHDQKSQLLRLFYLFVKSPVADEKQFCEAGKKYNILMVPGSSFACSGYVRLAYCVSYETIQNSLPEFEKLAAEYGL